MKSEARITAFFDVDDTLISIKSMFSFIDHLQSHHPAALGARFEHYTARLQDAFTQKLPREEVNTRYYRLLEDVPVALALQAGEDWYQRHASHTAFFIVPVLTALREHQAQGHNVAFVSGSFEAPLRPLANALGVSDLLCADLETHEAHYTGRLRSPPAIGKGKASRIASYARERDLDLTACFAYGDDLSDLPMLRAVGQPRLVNPSATLRRKFTHCRQVAVIPT
ncbi:MAG: HAD-IB family hydrolase [Oleiphilaceae bacterium]|nr:HAD-IB family hydrolase [Oleiphilaceae bacterium]